MIAAATATATTSGGRELTRPEILSHIAHHAARWYAAEQRCRRATDAAERFHQRHVADDEDFDIRRWERALERHDELLRAERIDQVHEYALLLDGLRDAETLSAELGARPPPSSPYHQRRRAAESAMLGAHRSDLERARLAWLAHATPELLAETNRS